MLQRFGLYTEQAVEQIRAEERSYADTILAAAIANAESGEAYMAGTEIASGEYGRAFAAATPEGDPRDAALLNPDILEYAARNLVATGEAALLVSRDTLIPLPNYEVDSHDHSISYMGQDGRRVRGQQIVFARWSLSPQTGRGIGPISRMKNLRSMVAGIEEALGMQAGNSAVGRVVPIPGNTDPDDPRVAQLRRDLARNNLAGGTAFVPSTQSMGEGRYSSPSSSNEWQPRTLSPGIEAASNETLALGSKLVLVACGVPIELLEKSDGTSRREAQRKFLHSSIVPVARKFCHACRVAGLRIERLNFDRLFAHDLSGRARSFQSLVKGGYTLQEAAALSGLLDEEN